MPISSSDVSNIISGQVGMFSASAQYAQAISNQYGFQAGGSIGINDPRGQQGQLQAGNVGAGMARVPGMAMGAAAGLAMFNVAPRIFDPFTMGAHMVRRGYLGGGIGGAIGMGIGAAGLMYGVSAATNFATENMVTGAQNRGLLNSQISSVFPHMNSGGLNMMAGQVEAMSRQGMGSIRELASLMQQGAATGSLDTGSLNQFSQSFRKLVSNVRQVANVLNSSMTEASQAMQSVKAIGVKSSEAANFLGAARGIGAAANLSPQQMMAVAQGGSQFAFSAGMDRQEGALGAMVSAGIYQMASNDENFNIDAGSQGRYTRAATRFLLGRRGRTILGAMMNRDGEFDASRAAMIARGAYSREELQEMYRSNINNQTMRRHLRNRGTEIAGQFIAQFGPEAISGSLDAMTRGSVDGVGRDTEMLQRTLTGLNRRDIDNMRQLAASAPMMRQRLVDEAKAGFREGQQSVSATQMMGIAFDRMIKPLREQFRQYGASMTRAAGDAMEEVTRTFVASPGARPDFQGLHTTNMAQLQGGEVGRFYAPGSFNPNVNAMATMPGRATGFGSFANYMPSFLRMGAMTPGTSLSELPAGGLSTLDPMDGMNLGAGAMALRYSRMFPGNRNIIGATGALMNATGKLYDAHIGTFGMVKGPQGNVRHPLMGLTGVNTLRGLARTPTGLLRAGGYLTMGLGRVAGAMALPVMAYSMLSGAGAAERLSGQQGIMEGALAGNNAALVKGLRDVGFLGDSDYEYHDIRDMTRRNFPGVPVSGTTAADGSAGSGYQGFIQQSGLEEVERLYASGLSSGDDYLGSAMSKLRGAYGDRASTVISQGFDSERENLLKKDLRSRIGAMDEMLQGLPGVELSVQERMALAFTQSDLVKFDRNRDYYKGRTGAEQRVAHGEAIRNLVEERGVQGLGGLAPDTVDAFADIMGGDGAKSIHDAQTAFIRGHKRQAREFLFDAVQGVSGVDQNQLVNTLMGQLGTESPLTQISAQAAGMVAEGYAENVLSPIVREQEIAELVAARGEYQGAIRDGQERITFGVDQGNRFLGLGRMDARTEVDRLAAQGPSALFGEGGMHSQLNAHLGRLFKAGMAPSEVAVQNAMNAYSRAGETGMAEKLINSYNLHKDYSKTKSSKDSTAKFLTQASRRMGMDLDFTKFKSTHDLDALRGNVDPSKRGMSSQLQAHLREFGSGLLTLQNKEGFSSAEAEKEATKVLDLLSQHKGDATQAIDAMTTMRPPSSVSAGKAMQGGLKEKVGAIDGALEDLRKAIVTKAAQIREG